MWAGLFWSRALLSISTGIFLIYAMYLSGRQGLKEVQDSIWLKGLILLFLLPCISGIWSADKKTWFVLVSDKLPLLLFPFTVPAFRLIVNKANVLLTYFVVFVLLSILYSMRMYFTLNNIHDLYLKAKVLKVMMSGDHVRYSLLLLIFLVWVIHQYVLMNTARWKGWLLICMVGLFLHILAAKTGLIGFYVLLFLLIMYAVKGLKKFGCIATLLSFPVIAWFLLPSFQNRLRFVWWDFQHYSRGGYVEGLSDTPRIFSLRGGIDLAKEHFIYGVGAGDVRSSIMQWYTKNAPFLKNYEQLLPSNEILFYTCSAGIISGIVVLFVLIISFCNKKNRTFLWIGFHLIFLMISMYEISLETQYGVFMYAFFGVLFFTISSPDHRLSRSSKAR